MGWITEKYVYVQTLANIRIAERTHISFYLPHFRQLWTGDCSLSWRGFNFHCIIYDFGRNILAVESSGPLFPESSDFYTWSSHHSVKCRTWESGGHPCTWSLIVIPLLASNPRDAKPRTPPPPGEIVTIMGTGEWWSHIKSQRGTDASKGEGMKEMGRVSSDLTTPWPVVLWLVVSKGQRLSFVDWSGCEIRLTPWIAVEKMPPSHHSSLSAYPLFPDRLSPPIPVSQSPIFVPYHIRSPVQR